MGRRGQAGEDQDRVVALRVRASPRSRRRCAPRAALPRATSGTGRATLRTCAHPWGWCRSRRSPLARWRSRLRVAAFGDALEQQPSTGSARRCPAASPGSPSPAGASAATLSAAAKVAPEEMPQKMPSLLASLRAVSMASASVTGTILWATSRFRTAGTKSGVQPWILCGVQGLPASSAAPGGLGGDDLGVRARQPQHLADAGERAAGAPAGDEVVQPLAGEVQQDLRGRWCCGDRPGSPGSRTAAPGTSRASWPAPAAFFTMPVPRSAAGVRMTLAPSMRMMLAALDGEGFHHDRHEGVALGRAHHGQRDAGVAGGGLDHGLAGLQGAAALGILDDRDRQAILDRGERVEELALHVHRDVLGRRGAGCAPPACGRWCRECCRRS